MGGKKRKKAALLEEPVVPAQDHRICGTICVCQMTAILSSVAIVYLSVAIYLPSMRAFYSGIVEQPVMCSTSKVVTVDKCNWGSCGEWCLSKTSGACVQIYVNLRNNGSTLEFGNCELVFNKTCYGVDLHTAHKYRCKQDECKNLRGTFNCTTGVCVNITDAFECVFGGGGADAAPLSPPLNCTGNRGKINCMDIDGLNTCAGGICSKIWPPYNCDRRCVGIPTRHKNVILLSGDKVFLSHCDNVTVLGGSNSSQIQPGPEEWPTAYPDPATTNSSTTPVLLWQADEDTVLLASCYQVWRRPSHVIQAADCVNGTFVSADVFSDFSNFTFLHGLSVSDRDRSAREQRIAPPEERLLIANDSRLMINLEGCVNTLREECKQFLKEYGKDGADHNARARFPCYYAEKDPSMAVTRFSLDVVYREFVPAAIVPLALFVFSCLTLVLCQQTVEVGDDAKMRFKKWRRGRARFADALGDAAEIVAMTEEEEEEGGERSDSGLEEEIADTNGDRAKGPDGGGPPNY